MSIISRLPSIEKVSRANLEEWISLSKDQLQNLESREGKWVPSTLQGRDAFHVRICTAPTLSTFQHPEAILPFLISSLGTPLSVLYPVERSSPSLIDGPYMSCLLSRVQSNWKGELLILISHRRGMTEVRGAELFPTAPKTNCKGFIIHTYIHDQGCFIDESPLYCCFGGWDVEREPEKLVGGKKAEILNLDKRWDGDLLSILPSILITLLYVGTSLFKLLKFKIFLWDPFSSLPLAPKTKTKKLETEPPSGLIDSHHAPTSKTQRTTTGRTIHRYCTL